MPSWKPCITAEAVCRGEIDARLPLRIGERDFLGFQRLKRHDRVPRLLLEAA